MPIWAVFAALAALFTVLAVNEPGWLRIIAAVSFVVAAIAAHRARKDSNR
ncbi:hypothetical protein [Actinoplanes sp. CA-252034]